MGVSSPCSLSGAECLNSDRLGLHKSVKKNPGCTIVRAIVAIKIILQVLISSLYITYGGTLFQDIVARVLTYAPSKMRKSVSFCIDELPHPSAISGILYMSVRRL